MSGGEAPNMKQRLEREKYPRESQHRAPNNDSLHNREHHSTHQHYTDPHHNHQNFPSTRLSASYQSVSHDGFPLYNSQYAMPHPHTHHPAPQHNTNDHHHPSSTAPGDNFHSSSNHLTGGKDAEYEYYEQLLKEQQQQFLNYQAQTAIRPQNGQVPVPEFSSISTSAMAGPSNSHDQAEFLSFNQYTAQMKDAANEVSNYNHQPAEQTETHNLFNQEYHQTSYETSPNQNIPHSEPTPYDNNYDSVYSLNPNYYNQRGFQSNIQSFSMEQPHNNNNSSHSKRGSAKRSPPNKKMDKAQRMLLYGVLHDVLDAKRAWEKNLRK